MPLIFLRRDITKMETDAIVNAANSSLLGGGGVDGAIHRAAGPELQKECRTLGGCKTGEAKATAGYRLPAKYVIHTVGPVWHGGGFGEEEALTACYKNSLALALKLGCESVAFPLISSGVYGYPRKQALAVAVRAISSFLENEDLTVYLTLLFEPSSLLDEHAYRQLSLLTCPPPAYRAPKKDDASSSGAPCAGKEKKKSGFFGVFRRSTAAKELSVDEETLEGPGEPFADTASVKKREALPVDEISAKKRETPSAKAPDEPDRPAEAPAYNMFAARRMTESALKKANEATVSVGGASAPDAVFARPESFGGREEDLAHLIRNADESFSSCLLRLIDRSGMTDVQCYKKANIDRKLFSKIRSNDEYRPSKPTVLAFAVALRLDLDETNALLQKAGYAFSHAQKFDIIVEYFIKNGRYDIFEINEALFAFDQALLGA